MPAGSLLRSLVPTDGWQPSVVELSLWPTHSGQLLLRAYCMLGTALRSLPALLNNLYRELLYSFPHFTDRRLNNVSKVTLLVSGNNQFQTRH